MIRYENIINLCFIFKEIRRLRVIFKSYFSYLSNFTHQDYNLKKCSALFNLFHFENVCPV